MSSNRDEQQPISKSEKLDELERAMMDAYESYQENIGHMTDNSSRDHERSLAEACHNYFSFADGKENGEPPVVKVETISDSQVPGLLEKAVKFCQMKLKKDEPSQQPPVTSQTTNDVIIPAKRPLKPTPKPQIVLTTTPTHQMFGTDRNSAFHRFRGANQQVSRGNTEKTTQGTSGVLLVQKEGHKPYTKITLVKPALKRQNFDNLKIPAQHHGIEMMRTELRRSSSVPSHNNNMKQKVFRTGSQMVAGSTLYRLKTSIRNGTSAALIRKPSITDQEIIQISDENSDDSDSDYSSSDDDDFDDVTSPANKKSKPSPPLTTQQPMMTSPTQLQVVMTTST